MKNNIENLIGNTPLLKISYIYKGKKKSAYFKAEWLNFTGSIKDRVAYQIIEDAINDGSLKQGQKIVEVTSGNMGISLCAVAKTKWIQTVIFMPKFMSQERQKILKMYGAELHLTEGFKEAFILAEEYAKKNDAFLSLQFENKSNTRAHVNTAKEILKQLKGNKISSFVAGMGTCGTLMGAGGYLKQKCNLKVIGVEPYSSQVFSRGESLGHHKIQGLSDDIIPKLYNKDIIDKLIQVRDEDALAMAQKLAKSFGFAVGISSGANFIASVLSNLNNTVSVFPDDNKKYLSTDLAKDISTPLVDSIKLVDFEVLN